MGTAPWTFLAENLAEVSCKSIQSHCFQHTSVVFMHFYGQGERIFITLIFLAVEIILLIWKIKGMRLRRLKFWRLMQREFSARVMRSLMRMKENGKSTII